MPASIRCWWGGDPRGGAVLKVARDLGAIRSNSERRTSCAADYARAMRQVKESPPLARSGWRLSVMLAVVHSGRHRQPRQLSRGRRAAPRKVARALIPARPRGGILDAEGRAAAAGGDDVRVDHLEAGAHEATRCSRPRAVDVAGGSASSTSSGARGRRRRGRRRGARRARAAYWKPEQPPPRTPTRRPAVSASAPARRGTRAPSRRRSP